jgi:hypothetical protein
MYPKIITALLLSTFLLACNDRQAVIALQTETEHSHDEAMKLMGPMNALVRNLKKELTEIDTSSTRYDSIQQVIKTAQKAEADMMDWMKNYKAPSETITKEEALLYLNQQKSAIEQNARDLQEVTSRAQLLIQKK